ncbi:putative bifunctional diguanylate cyclase/phosphodiesterase [Radiobacillus deserti]|nr:EAL domain-containing protein [Radiobacillus deserti]
MIAGLVSLILIPFDWMHVLHHGILLLEILFVSLFFLNGRAAKMFFVDFFYWITFGLVATVLFYKSFLSGYPLYFQISKEIVNGLFNVFVADMLLAYLPFYKMFSKKKVNPNNVSIHQFLSHITLLSIFIPFSLGSISSVVQANDFSVYQIEDMSKYAMSRLDDEMEHVVNSNGSIDEKALQELVQSDEFANHSFYIVDEKQHVVAARSTNLHLNETYRLKDHYEVDSFSSDVSVALPKEEEGLFSVNRWSNGQFIYEDSLEFAPLNVFFAVPIFSHQEMVYRNLLTQLLHALLLAVCLFLLVGTVSRLFMKNLNKLTVATTGLPDKIKQFEAVEWPRSYIAELRTLTKNLMGMADKIKELFEDSHHMTERLTDQTVMLKKSEDKLHHLAYYDGLTQLPNRLHFQNFVRSLITLDSIQSFAVIFIDLNQFKQVNDTLGHDAGDALLQMTADRLRALQVKHEREVFRLGGDEFVIVHIVQSEAEVHNSLDKIFEEFSHPFLMHDQTLFITPSVGVSMYPFDGDDLDALVKCADIAMYASKEKGGNIAQFFNESMRDRFQQQLIIENALRQVVDCGCGFELFYQPKVKANRVTGMEALLRWNHDELGPVSPGVFIPVAEDNGLIFQIDEWALYQACKQNKQWQDQGLLKIPISVNISAKHFQQDMLVTLIEKVLTDSGLAPQYLKIEITESVFIKDPEHVVKVIEKLKSIGVLISIDDFGKGYSSLNHLLELPIDEVKIDRQFIEGIDLDPKKGLFVNSILDIARGLNLNLVAEGVETEWEKATLEEIGDFELQGYLFSRPVDMDGMERYLYSEITNFSQYYSDN